MKTVKLAEALLRRKELNQKVEQLHSIKQLDLFETKVQRRNVTDSVDDIVASVAKLDASQVTEEYDYYASALRRVDAKIQQANWTTEVELDNDCLERYSKS